MSIQRKATVVSSLVASVLIVVKFIAGILSGSVAILASAIDSLLDLSASVFNLYAITKAEKPADLKFNYGRGKIESLAAVIEGSVILVSGIFILYQSLKKILLGSELARIDLSLYVMIFSLVLTTALVLYLSYVAKVSNNLVIKADALHYKTDILSNVAVLGALVLVKLTGFNIIDALFGIAIGLYVGYSAFGLLKEGVLVLLDRALDNDKQNAIKAILDSAKEVKSYHDLKTRQSGDVYFVEVHLVFNPEILLREAHAVADSIECKIQNLQGNWIVITHLDPYDDEGAQACSI
ncbi:cation diffusion facilitator family transporter [Helicobacter sp. Faydin-H64]|uniref:Cation diffusion facilitator family transporter n=2 Tax=Helicobacter turcicus TaxID=2867412 RepID=A0ABS7JPM2_9HELI|nr:cation diffusion facilitator family transporter [Helicobacter turcicus]MBX7546231.1 cation diffusion facilitator family transporter [Helicobacter turcicus]